MIPTTNSDDGSRAVESRLDGCELDEEEGYADAVTRHAKYLGIDPDHDAAYLWIAEEVRTSDAIISERTIFRKTSIRK